jgi:tRNA-dihydrouridine synthase A
MRLMTQQTLLYTEMITTAAILNGDRPRLLDFSPEEKPLILQLGGDNPQELATCAQIAEAWGYDGVNLNVGCPSDRVQNGHFGACLMAHPEQVGAAVAAMKKATVLPISVKHRIGINERDRYEDLQEFVRIVSEAGCRYFTVHARKAWLQGLSPKENRTIPPLRYDDVHRLKQDFPHLWIEINGGFTGLDQVQHHLAQVDAVMIGRAATETPYLLAAVDPVLYGSSAPVPTREAIALALLPYIEAWVSRGLKLHKISRHLLQLFAGCPGSRAWKQHLTLHASRPGAGTEVIVQALDAVRARSHATPALSSN